MQSIIFCDIRIRSQFEIIRDFFHMDSLCGLDINYYNRDVLRLICISKVVGQIIQIEDHQSPAWPCREIQ
jgi:hypothetical protein